MQRPSKSYDDGYKAAFGKKPKGANPFTEGTRRWALWNEGYAFAKSKGH